MVRGNDGGREGASGSTGCLPLPVRGEAGVGGDCAARLHKDVSSFLHLCFERLSSGMKRQGKELLFEWVFLRCLCIEKVVCALTVLDGCTRM